MNNISLPSILTVDEAAQYLRVNVDELNIELTSKRIPALRIANTWRIKRDTLDKLLEPSITHNENKKDEFVTSENLFESQFEKVNAFSEETTTFQEINEKQFEKINDFSMEAITFQEINEKQFEKINDFSMEAITFQEINEKQYIDLGDLYNSTLPVSGRNFFGREKWLVQLFDLVQQGQFFGIYGLRKMGKTSLIYQFRDERLRGEAVAYVDLQASPALTEKNCAPIYWELEHDLYNRLSKHDKEITELLRLGKIKRFSDLPDRGANAGLMFNEDLRALLEAMSAGKTQFKKLVIVLDELERILPIAGQEGVQGYLEFFGLLRGLAQRYRGLLSSIVVAANSALSERGYWDGKENPVFALYKPHFLSPLSKEDCVAMIRTLGKGMSVYWEDDAIETVFTETNGHPFITRLLCSRIAKRHSERPLTVTVDNVQEEVPCFIRDEGDKLEQITALLNSHFPDEAELLEQIALDEAPSELQDSALSHLFSYQLISSEQGDYQVSFNLLRRWLRRRVGIKE